ncbi:BCCT family transporter [Metabacillus sp. BG109]|uniref:BCCT family transporter n=1 Tax=Metabacillus bambusae TaxID=2795218 RepID=A0ABS3MZY4_9BACI|nr:BCCT family transporter [Metabacillus bambusae]
MQTASIVSAFPFIFILLIMIVSLSKALREDYQKIAINIIKEDVLD